MNIENQKFEEWRKEQIASLIRMGYPDAAKAFRDLGSVQWSGWTAGWQASRAAIEIDLASLDVRHDTDTNHEPCGPDLYDAEDVRILIQSSGAKVKL